MFFTSPLQTEAEFQWDPDSVPNQAFNCGPTSVEKVANYYRDTTDFGIERTRDLGTKRDRSGTYLSEQKQMLQARGVEAEMIQVQPEEVIRRVSTGRWPLILCLNMRFIPDDVKGHSFDGTHSVTALARGTEDGVMGLWINEPNQHRGQKEAKKLRFFPDKYWIAAFKAFGRWIISPTKPKVIPTRVPIRGKWRATTTVNRRSAPTAQATDTGNLVAGHVVRANMKETMGGSYVVGRKVRRDWIGFIDNGKQRWAAAGYLEEVK